LLIACVRDPVRLNDRGLAAAMSCRSLHRLRFIDRIAKE
jgi:hypothetical protein